MLEPAYKIGHLADGIWQERVHPPVFRDSSSRETNPRIEATLPHGDTKVFGKLTECMSEPCIVLYVFTPHVAKENLADTRAHHWLAKS